MTGFPIHIEVRTNPDYQYDIVLEEINYNFEYLNTNFSGSSTGHTFVDGTNTFVKTILSSTSYNVTGLSIDNIYVSGISQFNTLSATSVYASGISQFNTLSAKTLYANNVVLTGDTIDGGSF